MRPAPVTRRAFLTGSAAVASATVLGARPASAAGATGAKLAAAGLDRQVSVGYVVGSAGLDTLDRAVVDGPVRVKPATEVAADTSYLGRSIRVAVLGGTALGAVRQVQLDLDWIVPSAAGPLHVYQWNRRVRAGSVSEAHDVRWTVPITRAGGLALSLDDLADTRAGTAGTVISAAGEPTLPRLRRGIYLIGVGAGAFSRATSFPSGVDRPAVIVSVDRG